MKDSPFVSGNVIKRKKSKDLYIVTDDSDTSTVMIPIDGTNCHIYAAHEKKYSNETCSCYIDQRCPDPLCKTCKGKGWVKMQHNYIGDYEYVADTIKDFFVDRLTSFEF